MRRLHHLAFSPFGRFVRLVLAEKGLEAASVEEKSTSALAWLTGAPEPNAAHDSAFWTVRAMAAPLGAAPVLEDGALMIGGSGPIAEYLEESAPGRRLLGDGAEARAEARRIMAWAEGVLYPAMVEPVLVERILKTIARAGAPESERLRGASAQAPSVLARIGALLEDRRWLAGEELTLADFAVGAQLSVLDYRGDVPWERGPALARGWYALLKSRPAFRGVLADRAPGLPPAPHYDNPDF